MREKKLFFITLVVVITALTIGLWAHSRSDFRCVLSDSSTNPTVTGFNDAYQEISVDTYKIKVSFYNANNVVYETEIYGGDEFPEAGGWYVSHTITEDLTNCEYYQAVMKVVLTDGTIYRNIESNIRYKPF